jgi:glycerophosphoryl diester phosphodiesterase
MGFEVQAHRGNDELTLRRLLQTAPSSVEIDIGLIAGEIVIAHDTDLADASGLTMDAALLAAGGSTVVIEAKCFPPETPSPRAFVAALQPYLARIALCSFEERVLVEALRARPTLETTFLFKSPQPLATSARTIGPRHDLVTRELVASAHALGLRVVPWTVNDVPTMAALVDLGVDGLVTDEPALAHEVAASRLAAAA